MACGVFVVGVGFWEEKKCKKAKTGLTCNAVCAVCAVTILCVLDGVCARAVCSRVCVSAKRRFES